MRRSSQKRSFDQRLREVAKRFRENFLKSLKGPLITKPHLEMTEREAKVKDDEAKDTH